MLNHGKARNFAFISQVCQSSEERICELQNAVNLVNLGNDRHRVYIIFPHEITKLS